MAITIIVNAITIKIVIIKKHLLRQLIQKLRNYVVLLRILLRFILHLTNSQNYCQYVF